jgi:cobalt-zinc-cadmium efflux system outer membrane protein
VSLGARRLELMTRFADLAERQLASGDISSLDRDLALLARDEAAAEQATLLSERATAHEALRKLDRAATSAPLPDFPAIDLPAAAPREAWRLESLPERLIAQAADAYATRQVQVAEADSRADPTVLLRAGSIDLGETGVRDEVYGVSVTVPLFVRNRYQAEVAAAKSDARSARADASRIELELQARASRAAASYDAVRLAWQQWRKSLGTDVEKRSTLLERLWKAGELSTPEYLLQLKQTLDTALAGADLEGRLWAAYTEYLAATGQLEQWLGLADK